MVAHTGAAQLPDNMWVSKGRRVFLGCFHIVLLWLAVQALIIAEGIQRQNHVDMQLQTLENGGGAYALGMYHATVRVTTTHLHTTTTSDMPRAEVNEYLLELLDRSVGEQHIWEEILRNNTMPKPWMVPYTLGDTLGQKIEQQLFGPRNTTCVGA